MIERGWRRVINVASPYASLALDTARYPGLEIDIPSHVASKHALLGLTRHAAPAIGGRDVAVNAISPGMLPTTQENSCLLL